MPQSGYWMQKKDAEVIAEPKKQQCPGRRWELTGEKFSEFSSPVLTILLYRSLPAGAREHQPVLVLGTK